MLALAFGILALPGAFPFLIVSCVPARTCRRILTGGLGDFLIDLVGEIFELALCSPQGRCFVAQHAPGRPFDPLAHLLYSLAGVPRCLGGLFCYAQPGQLLGGLERIGDLMFVRLADRIIEILGQKRLGFLGVLDGIAHLVEKLVEGLLLLFEPLGHLLRSPVSRSVVWGWSLAASSCSESFF